MNEFTVLDLLDLDLREHNNLQLKCIAGRSGLSRTIRNSKISRPGLAFTGFFEAFSGQSIQLIGRAEQSYIDMLEKRNEYGNIEKFFSYDMPCIVFIGGYKPSEHFIELAEKNAVAILSTPLESSDFSSRLYSLLDEVFAATMTIHGVLVDVYGIMSGNIKACKPHIHNNGNFEIGLDILKLAVKLLALVLSAQHTE